MVEDVYLRLPVNALVSYHYFKNRDIDEIQSWGYRLIGDSGAYSASTQGTPIDIDEFMTWGIKWRDTFCWVASLDVIGDKDASWTNYRYLRDGGLDVIPTIHYGCDPSELDRYAAEGVDFVGLGGMVGRKSEAQRLLRWCLRIFKYARDNHPQMRFHGWGVTHNKLIMDLPWYSVDSSGFSSSYRFARLGLFDKSLGKNVGIDLNGKDIYQHADLLLRDYNISPSEVAVSTNDTRRQLVRLSVASVQRQEDFLRRRHKVTAPKYGINDTYKQTSNIHTVTTAIPCMKEIADISISPTQNKNIIIADAPNIHTAFGAIQYMQEVGDISISPTQGTLAKEKQEQQ
jgi:hypothetical protein